MSGRRLPALVLIATVALGACGGRGEPEKASAPPPAVPVALVPPSLTNGGLTLSEDDQARKTFGKLSDRALVADGRLWQIREGDRLVATLQVSSVKTKIDLRDADQRATIVKHILPGARQEIDVNGLAVSTSDVNEKTMFVWFGRDLFQVLQIKSTKLDPEAIITELVGYQLQSPEWIGLPTADDVSS